MKLTGFDLFCVWIGIAGFAVAVVCYISLLLKDKQIQNMRDRLVDKIDNQDKVFRKEMDSKLAGIYDDIRFIRRDIVSINGAIENHQKFHNKEMFDCLSDHERTTLMEVSEKFFGEPEYIKNCILQVDKDGDNG